MTEPDYPETGGVRPPELDPAADFPILHGANNRRYPPAKPSVVRSA